MYGTLNKNHWEPDYPESNTNQVSLKHDELTLNVYKQLPIIIQDNSAAVEDPACFWIDKHHIYLRSNWNSWNSVDDSNSSLVETLLKCGHCYVGASQDDYNYKYSVAPVYHITKLPKDLFDKVSYGEEHGERLIIRDEEELDEEESLLAEYMELFKSSEQKDASLKEHSFFWKEVSELTDRFKKRLEFKFNATVKGYVADLMITNKGNCALLLDFLKDDELENYDDHAKKLRRMRLYFKVQNPGVRVGIGVVVSKTAAERIYNVDDLHLIVGGKVKKGLFDFLFLS